MVGNRAYVLVIEDHPPNATLVCDVLEFHDFETRWAMDGLEGLAMIRERTPDLILMDIQMPRMDGYTLARLLKSDPSTAEIPIIALTARAMPGDANKAIEAGCDGYLTKPVNTRALPTTLRDFLVRFSNSEDSALSDPSSSGT